jgi:enoyl-CoA hydratase/carnithine racemase
MGLVQRVVEEPLSVAEEIAANDPESLAHLKRLVRAEGDREAREAREREAFVDLLSVRAAEIADR